MDDIIAGIKAHPVIVAVAVIIVAALGLYVSKQSAAAGQSAATGGGNATGFAGGGAASPIDPNAAAISEAAISAGATNVQTLASLIGLEDTTQAGLTSSLASTAAGTYATEVGGNVALGESANNRDVALATLDAQEQEAQDANSTSLGLASISAQAAAAAAATAAAVASAAANNRGNQGGTTTQSQNLPDIKPALDGTTGSATVANTGASNAVGGQAQSQAQQAAKQGAAYVQQQEGQITSFPQLVNFLFGWTKVFAHI